ncbi:unnamed protein product [Rhizophagus irregularis]|uniref:Uncharacterized protein n=1 Tax=Rhizophagus irregularis TaxID=588596 RepID=A0A916E4K6_9GLOM|nr:unnamed protein product [Rhizophagus irregularis]
MNLGTQVSLKALTILLVSCRIRDYLPNLITKDTQSLRKKRIIYMDQLTSPDSYLLTWKEIQNSRFLVQKQNSMMVIDVRTRLRPKYPPNELIHIRNNKDKQIIFYKTAIAQDSYSTTSITNGEHYIPFLLSMPSQDTTPRIQAFNLGEMSRLSL